MSSFGRLARRPNYDISYGFLIAPMYFGRLARRPEELMKFARYPSLELSGGYPGRAIPALAIHHGAIFWMGSYSLLE